MANILLVIPGLSLSDLGAMTFVELAEWHQRAVDRAPKSE